MSKTDDDMTFLNCVMFRKNTIIIKTKIARIKCFIICKLKLKRKSFFQFYNFFFCLAVGVAISGVGNLATLEFPDWKKMFILPLDS